MSKNDVAHNQLNQFRLRKFEGVIYLMVIILAIICRILKVSPWILWVLIPIIFATRIYYVHFKKD